MALQLPGFSDEDEPPELVSTKGRTLFYRAIAQELRDKTGNGRSIQQAGRRVGLRLMRSITELIFLALMRDGVYRFPDGFGSLHIRRSYHVPQTKRLPGGEQVVMPVHRVRIAFKEGAVTRAMIGLRPQVAKQARKYPRRTRLAKKTLQILKEPTV